MLMRTDPFRVLDRITRGVFGAPGPWSTPSAMPMAAHRAGDEYVAAPDVPGGRIRA
jgi:HSP20 family protein